MKRFPFYLLTGLTVMGGGMTAQGCHDREKKALYTPYPDSAKDTRPVAPTPTIEVPPGVVDPVERFLNAAKEGNLVEVKQSLRDKVPIDSARDGVTAILQASLDKKPETLQFLAENGADVNLAAHNGITPLMSSVDRNETESVKVLLKYGAKVNQLDGKGRTAIMYGANRGFIDLVKLLIEHGADVNIVTADGETALSRALANAHSDVAELLRAAGAKK